MPKPKRNKGRKWLWGSEKTEENGKLNLPIIPLALFLQKNLLVVFFSMKLIHFLAWNQWVFSKLIGFIQIQQLQIC
jgi:hypothetical protein